MLHTIEPGPRLRRHSDVPANRQAARDLRQAVLKRAFILHYHPRCSLATGAALGAEAKVCWPHRRHGLVASGTFLPLAERTGLDIALGGWVLDEACRRAAAWPAGHCLTVTLSAGQLEGQGVPDQVARAVQRAGLRPERLDLALPEAMMAGYGTGTLLTLSDLRDQGVGLTLADFGARHASLSMLRNLPLTGVKLDTRLVQGLPHERDDAAVVRAAVQAAHALGLDVVADGVQREEQRAFLSGIGCDAGQGELFGLPRPT